MSLEDFIKVSISREDNLFRQVYGFNMMIGEYTDPSHYPDDVLREWVDPIKSSRRATERLSEYLLETFNLTHRPWYHFEDPRMRLALMSPEKLQLLILYAGAVPFAERISKIIAKKQLMEVKEALGEKLYFFVTKKSVLIAPLIPKMTLPEVSVPTKQDVFNLGKEAIEICFANESDAFLDRFKLKFPADVEWNFHPNGGEERKSKYWQYLYRLFIKEIEPGAQPCFS